MTCLTKKDWHTLNLKGYVPQALVPSRVRLSIKMKSVIESTEATFIVQLHLAWFKY